jgi:hypothetical protein
MFDFKNKDKIVTQGVWDGSNGLYQFHRHDHKFQIYAIIAKHINIVA